MILTCPNCATRYMVDPAKLGAGRIVRCAACRHSWHQERPAAAPARIVPIPTAIDPRPTAAEREIPRDRMPRDYEPEPESTPERERGGGVMSWLFLFVVIVALMAAGYVERARVVEFWPPALKFYRMVGLMPAPMGEGLSVRNIVTRRSVENGQQLLTVEGEVVNESNESRVIPPLVATLSDAQHRDVQHWSFELTEPKLLPGEHAPFLSHLVSPSADATALTIAFSATAK